MWSCRDRCEVRNLPARPASGFRILRAVHLGYTENAIVHGGRLDEGIELLSKPYTRDALARKIRHVLRNQQQRNLSRTAAARNAGAAALRTPWRVLLVEDDAEIRWCTAPSYRISDIR